MTGGWRWELSRFRFSWVELVGVVCALRVYDGGTFIEALATLVLFAIAQAALTSWRA